MKWKIEDDVDHFVQGELEKLGLRKYSDFGSKTSMSAYMKSALAGGEQNSEKNWHRDPRFSL
ncbi:hypothetical protein ACNFV2_005012 [Escherichia coli]|uniref:hypothetical protein n=1 Tax=Escherichia coli TaxID=562 RepID=UPI00192F3C9F|nr:hypothetical protein [Escherichia coli]EHL6100655.1 hypothetical protein [Escherichia coli]EIF7408148.1 hypothetical protein [Escherichia coli]MCD4235961.1 hypothetical protein [Escherichia coli]HEB0398764.1 hypothetical protein [Escherichia coli]